jgi:hypothetical protein
METDTILTEAELKAIVQKHFRQFVRRVTFARLKGGAECLHVEFINNNVTGEIHAETSLVADPD